MNDLEAAYERIAQLEQQVTDLEWELYELKRDLINKDHEIVSLVRELLDLAESKSTLNSVTQSEGLMFKSLDTQDQFKAISNKWLLKNES
jgi:predicted RNase H-like nuclease (RuvC/YqgF family)